MHKRYLRHQRSRKPSLSIDGNAFYYIVSYFLVMLIPLLVFGLLIFNGFIRILAESRLEDNYSNLVTISQEFDRIFIELRELSSIIDYDSELSTYNSTKNPYRSMRAIERLRSYVSPRPFLHDIYLYSRQRDYLHNSSSAMLFDFYRRNASPYDKHDELIRDSFTSQKPVLLAGEGAGRFAEFFNIPNMELIPYIIPLNMDQSVCFLINEPRLRRQIQTELLDRYQGITAVLDQNLGMVTASTPGTPPVDLAHIAELLRVRKNGRLSVQDRRYLATKLVSARTGFVYLNLIEDDIIMRDIYSLRRSTFIILLVILIVCSTLITLLSYKNYYPLLAIKGFVSSLLERTPPERNVIDYIRHALVDISAMQQKMQGQIAANKDAAKHFILLRLLNGYFPEIASVNALGKSCGLHFGRAYFAVLIVNFPESAEHKKDDKKSIIEAMEQALPAKIQGYGSESFNENNLVFILCSNHRADAVNREGLEALRRKIQADFGYSLTLGLGRFYKDIADIGRSYLEAITSIDYRFLRGRENLILFTDIPLQIKKIDWYPEQEIRKLEILIRQRDSQGIDRLLSSIMQRIEQGRMSLFLARCICYEVIRVIIHTASELDIPLDSISEDLPDITSLMRADTLAVLSAMLRDMIRRICNTIDDHLRLAGDHLLGRIEGYIEEHFCGGNFSVQLMADALGISPSYLSKHYKSKTGAGVWQYINQLRIERAKELLVTTDDKIAHIVSAVGYFNESSFIRKFKLAVGITPGEYRKLIS